MPMDAAALTAPRASSPGALWPRHRRTTQDPEAHGLPRDAKAPADLCTAEQLAAERDPRAGAGLDAHGPSRVSRGAERSAIFARAAGGDVGACFVDEVTRSGPLADVDGERHDGFPPRAGRVASVPTPDVRSVEPAVSVPRRRVSPEIAAVGPRAVEYRPPRRPLSPTVAANDDLTVAGRQHDDVAEPRANDAVFSQLHPGSPGEGQFLRPSTKCRRPSAMIVGSSIFSTARATSRTRPSLSWRRRMRSPSELITVHSPKWKCPTASPISG